MSSTRITFVITVAIMAVIIGRVAGERRFYYTSTTDRYDMKGKHRAGPTIKPAPLDPNHEIATLEEIIGMVAGGASGLVASLTGISTTNCANEIKGNLSKMTCAQFLKQLSNCESLMQVKSLVQAARRKQAKNPNSKQPCFT